MAEKRVIEIEVKENFKQVEKDLDNLNESLKETANSSRDVNKTFEEVYGDLQPLTTRLGEAEDRLYELAAAGQTTTQEYKDLLNTVAGYRRVQMQTDMVVDAASTTMSTKMTNAIGGVANAFSIAEGASALMGVESEKLQETMVKLQAAMAISQGIQGLKEGGLAFKQLGQSAMTALKGIRTGLAATGIGLFVIALGTIVAYWDDIKSAVNGVTAEQEKLNETYKKNAIVSKEIYESLQLQENSLRLQGKTEKEILQLRIQKINAAIKDEEIRIKGLEETSKMEVAAQERNMKWLKLYVRAVLEGMAFAIRALAIPIDKVIETANFVSKALGNGELVATNLNEYISKGLEKASEWTAKLLFDPEEVKAESKKTINEAKKGLKQMQSDRDGFLLSLKEINKKGSTDAIENKKAELDALIELEIRKDQTDKKRLEDLLAERLKLEKLKGNQLLLAEKDNAEKVQAALNEDIAKELAARNEANKNKITTENEYLDQIAELQEQNRQKIMTEEELEISAVNEKYFALEEAAKNNADELATIEQAKANELNDINLKYQQIKYDADKAAADAELELRKRNRDFAIESAVSMMSTITELAAQSQEKYEALNQAVLDNDKLTDSEKQKLLDANNKKAKKAFDIQKAANIASALITTYQSATSAYASQFVPVPDPSSPIRGGIAAGLAVAAGLANVKKIASQKFEGASLSGGSSSGGGSVPDAGTMQAPNFSVIGSSGVNQLAQLQQQPVQAYVVSGEVTSQQALDRNRVQNATL